LLDQQRVGQYCPFIGAKSLMAVVALPPTADASPCIMRSINHTRIFSLAIRTPHHNPELEHLLPPYMAVAI